MLPLNEKGPGVAPPEPLCIAFVANAVSHYSFDVVEGNQNAVRRALEHNGGILAAVELGSGCRSLKAGKKAPECPVGAFEGQRRVHAAKTAYRDSEGRFWRYRGKRARVLQMLVTMSQGVTQHDTYPWHTRLGGTIHALREDGLVISTELEGPYRHARYRLATELSGDDGRALPLKLNQRKSREQS